MARMVSRTARTLPGLTVVFPFSTPRGQVRRVTGQNTCRTGKMSGGPRMGGVISCVFYPLALVVEIIPRIKGSFSQSIPAASIPLCYGKSKGTKLIKGTASFFPSMVTRVGGVFIKAAAPLLVAFIKGSQIQKIDGLLKAHRVSARRAEHIRQTPPPAIGLVGRSASSFATTEMELTSSLSATKSFTQPSSRNPPDR